MPPILNNGNVSVECRTCNGVKTSYERTAQNSGQYGSITRNHIHDFNGERCNLIHFRLLRCASCGSGGLAVIHQTHPGNEERLESFFPVTVEVAAIPSGVPDGIVKEFREAERCAVHGAFRAASALLRSVLEKTLKKNGYNETNKNLKQRIDDAASDGVLTDARKRRAHDEVRVLGNDIVHDDWREVLPAEFELAHRYTGRIIEDFYDDRPTVEALLQSKGRVIS